MAPFRWPSLLHDLALAREVAATAPEKPSDWDTIASNLSGAFSTEDKIIEVKGRGCRERMERLLEKYRKEDTKALKRSGTEEDFTELNQLCEDILTFRRDMAAFKFQEKEAKNKKIEEDRRRGEDMRKSALEGISKRHSSEVDSSICSSGDDSDSDSFDPLSNASGSFLQGCQKKKTRKRASKLTAMEMLASKYKRKVEFQEKELEVRKQELQFQKEKFEAEAAERKTRLELELQERRVMSALSKDKLNE